MIKSMAELKKRLYDVSDNDFSLILEKVIKGYIARNKEFIDKRDWTRLINLMEDEISTLLSNTLGVFCNGTRWSIAGLIFEMFMSAGMTLAEITKIPNGAFWGSDLEHILIPENIECVDQAAFNGAKKLKELAIENIEKTDVQNVVVVNKVYDTLYVYSHLTKNGLENIKGLLHNGNDIYKPFTLITTKGVDDNVKYSLKNWRENFTWVEK